MQYLYTGKDQNMVSKLFPAFSKNTANAIFSKTSCLYKY